MKRALTILATALAALMLVPAFASAEYLIPEGNSAVNQYTEGVPSAGGQKGTRNGEFHDPVKPSKAIGAENAQKFDEAGPEGQAAAEVAAETSPVASEEREGQSQASGNGKKKADKGKGQGNGKGDQGKGKPDDGEGNSEKNGEATSAIITGGSDSGGSSGIGSVLAAATGSEDGNLGLLLPLVILAAIAWGGFYALRRRKLTTE